MITEENQSWPLRDAAEEAPQNYDYDLTQSLDFDSDRAPSADSIIAYRDEDGTWVAGEVIPKNIVKPKPICSLKPEDLGEDVPLDHAVSILPIGLPRMIEVVREKKNGRRVTKQEFNIDACISVDARKQRHDRYWKLLKLPPPRRRRRKSRIAGHMLDLPTLMSLFHANAAISVHTKSKHHPYSKSRTKGKLRCQRLALNSRFSNYCTASDIQSYMQHATISDYRKDGPGAGRIYL